MRVLIDTTYARLAPYSGTAVYVREIVAALRRLGDVEVVTTANESRRPPGSGRGASVRNAAADLRFTERTLPRRARATGAEVIHHPLAAHAHLPSPSVAQVVTVHDLAFERVPERFASTYRRWAHLAHRHAARQAGAVICPSETTAADVRELWGVAPARIVVAPHGPGQEHASAGERPAPRHFLYVGDAERRKDLPTLLAAHLAYARATPAPLPLVLAGSAAAAQPHVIVEPHPGPDRLHELLLGAAALVHPAVHEGFGLTLAEAMSSGTPVIAAAAAGTTETCGDAARYVVSGDPQMLADTLAQLAADPVLRSRLSERGRTRAGAFSWKLAARAHRDAYSLALAR